MSTLLLGSRTARSILGFTGFAIKPSYLQELRSSLRASRSLSSSPVGPFHFNVVETPQYSSNIVFLHGLLGNGKNLRTFARELCRQQQARGILVDLPGHGSSKHCLAATTSISNCLLGLHQTLQAAGIGNDDDDDDDNVSWSLVGHSMGGRIALQYANHSDSFPQPQRLVLLDTVPGGLNASVMHVMRVAETFLPVVAQTNLTRKELVHKLTQEHGIDLATAQWLGGSYDTQTREFSFSLEGARNLVHCFFERNDPTGLSSFVETIEHVLRHNVKIERVDIVRGGKNRSWDSVQDQVSQLEALEQFPPSQSQLRVHLLPNAGHWVHTDDLPGLIQVLKS
ncbi:hypothetical protein FisN_3Lh260 [Fistulifera solaris]|uniref:AB hydrolase-1 domain-containing protein n=1 Tax=Fistulifera solaris TaxID=1519565 RepID=A0A1Z5JP90_FISSO|nr:hypothetical protein FisN_3Lh260 [Fistulifera solaris]|eukprot:GAX15814.1 hypothetical protein FisN_3Lh260 [Fistulifera solaris]